MLIFKNQMRSIEKYWLYFLGLPKTIYFNFKYLSFFQALKLPIWVSPQTWLLETGGKVEIKSALSAGMVKIGFGEVGIFDRRRARSIWQVRGKVIFQGRAFIGHGSKLSVEGELVIGDNLIISAEASIVCKQKIVLGRDCLISWQTLIMDTDFHKLKNKTGKILNPNAEIQIGDKVWLCLKTTVLKGVKIGSGSVLAAGTILTRSLPGKNLLIAGNPAAVKKENIYWE